MKKLIFDIPRNQSVRETESLMRQHLHLKHHASGVITRKYLDTYDWRIFNTGGLLEVVEADTGNCITWRSIGGDRINGRYPVTQIPRFVWDIKVSGFRKRLENILEVRALLPIAIVPGRIHVFSILNKQNKTVLRLEIQCDHIPEQPDRGKPGKRSKILDKRVHLYPMKGYARAYKQTCKILQEECHLVPITVDPFVKTLEAIGCEPVRHIQKSITMNPDLRADITAKDIFHSLLDEMERNEDGLRQDIDSEFLHDFRVAVRRIRSLLGRVKGILPGRRIARFSREFAWLGNITGPTRDMDVYLLSFEAFKQQLPQRIREDLMPLKDFLRRHRMEERNHLVKALNSARYRRIKQDWKNFLIIPPPQRSTLPNADRPVIYVAGKLIWRIYRKAIKQGNKIGPDSPATSLHELRKTCKKLRYLNEFFRELYPVKKIGELIDSLKDLQDNLGEFQDLEVQQASLRSFTRAMDQETGITPETRHAMDMLVSRLEQRERQVRKEFAARFRKFASRANHRLYKRMVVS